MILLAIVNRYRNISPCFSNAAPRREHNHSEPARWFKNLIHSVKQPRSKIPVYRIWVR